MLSNKQKMDLLMESLEAIERDSESLNEFFVDSPRLSKTKWQTKSVDVTFNDELSNDEQIAFAIQSLRNAIWNLTSSGDLDDDKRKFVQDKLKGYGININNLEKLRTRLYRLKARDFNYPPAEKSNTGPGPFDV